MTILSMHCFDNDMAQTRLYCNALQKEWGREVLICNFASLWQNPGSPMPCLRTNTSQIHFRYFEIHWNTFQILWNTLWQNPESPMPCRAELILLENRILLKILLVSLACRNLWHVEEVGFFSLVEEKRAASTVSNYPLYATLNPSFPFHFLV